MESSLIIPIITGIVAALAGLGLGKLIFAKDTQARVEEAKKQAAQILSDAEFKSENLKKEKLLEAKSDLFNSRQTMKETPWRRTRKSMTRKTGSSRRSKPPTKSLRRLKSR